MSDIVDLTFGDLMEISRKTKVPLKNIFDVLVEADNTIDEDQEK